MDNEKSCPNPNMLKSQLGVTLEPTLRATKDLEKDDTTKLAPRGTRTPLGKTIIILPCPKRELWEPERYGAL